MYREEGPLPALGILGAGLLLGGILAGVVLPFRAEERRFIEREIIERDAAVLYPEALQQTAEAEADMPGDAEPAELLTAVLRSARPVSSGSQTDGMIAAAVYGDGGREIDAVPQNLVFADLAPADYARLLGGEHISRYDPRFPLGRYFAGVSGSAPVLEVLLPLHGRNPSQTLGFIQYYLDATRLDGELIELDRRFNRETATTLGAGLAMIAVVLALGYTGLRMIARRNRQLRSAHFELALSAKTSALGQITSHLIHGLQGPVAGLRAVVATQPHNSPSEADWKSAAAYAERLQVMIQETVEMLGDEQARISYEMTGDDLLRSIQRRSAPAAQDRKVELLATGGFRSVIDSRRGGLVCLVAANLLQNAIAATPSGGRVEVILAMKERLLELVIRDQGDGIPEEMRAHLFEPGRSGRPGGSGLGLAISRLIARHIGATLELADTGPHGTTFRLSLPT